MGVGVVDAAKLVTGEIEKIVLMMTQRINAKRIFFIGTEYYFPIIHEISGRGKCIYAAVFSGVTSAGVIIDFTVGIASGGTSAL